MVLFPENPTDLQKKDIKKKPRKIRGFFLCLQNTASKAVFRLVIKVRSDLFVVHVCGIIPVSIEAVNAKERTRITSFDDASFYYVDGSLTEAVATERKEIHVGGNGHGCGHNILGAGAFAAALGVKAYLEKNDISGTVILYGCPGEEGGAAKAFMARDGVWKKLDAALTWHPEDVNEVATLSYVGLPPTRIPILHPSTVVL